MRKLMSDAQRAAWHIVNSEKKKFIVISLLISGMLIAN